MPYPLILIWEVYTGGSRWPQSLLLKIENLKYTHWIRLNKDVMRWEVGALSGVFWAGSQLCMASLKPHGYVTAFQSHLWTSHSQTFLSRFWSAFFAPTGTGLLGSHGINQLLLISLFWHMTLDRAFPRVSFEIRQIEGSLVNRPFSRIFQTDKIVAVFWWEDFMRICKPFLLLQMSAVLLVFSTIKVIEASGCYLVGMQKGKC